MYKLFTTIFLVFTPILKAQDGVFSRKIITPDIGVKTNILYIATTTLNVGAEFKLSDKYTFDFSINYNPWTFSNNKKIKHLLLQPELRYWICDPFDKHFFGFHLLYAHYNIGSIKLPLGIYPSLENSRYQGDLYGAGFSYGYQWYLSPRWSIEATFGFGYVYTDYDRYQCKTCGTFIESGNKHYFGPTKAGVSLIYFLK